MSDPVWHRPDPVEVVGDGITRYSPPAALRAGAEVPPSLAVVGQKSEVRGQRSEFPPAAAQRSGVRGQTITPVFALDERGRWVVRVAAAPGTSFYGAGEIAGPLLRNGRRVVCWNTDSFEYDDTKESLYQSHPWVLGVRSDGTSFGVLADTTFRCTLEFGGAGAEARPGSPAGDGLAISAEGLPFEVYVVEREEPGQVVAALADLTGHMPLPPKWALGFHQSRWSYEPDTQVLEIAREFRARRMPADCIWLDIDYMEGFRCFTFDPQKFPEPRRLNDDLHALGFKSIWMIDCGFKVDENDPVYRSGREGDHFIRTAGGEEFKGSVWPGLCAFPDFTREATRRWWAELYKPFLDTGLDGVWNDMNEPAVFDNPSKQPPEDLQHRADEEIGGPGPHSRYRNVYGMLMVRASREGMQRARPGKRPFILTRSNFVGGHRYAATWTGDNVANSDHLSWSIPMVLNMGLSGQPFSGPDIGGFSGNADARLFARWMGIGALLPFARVHSIKDSQPREPWAMGEECERACRAALERRYRLMPYLYTLFHEAAMTGLPIARPLFFGDPRDQSLRDADDAFLLGSDLLVRCAVEPDGACQAAFPHGRPAWRGFDLGELETTQGTAHSTHPELPEMYVRAGSIIPIGPVMQWVDERPLDPLTLVVAPDARGEAVGVLYEDAGEGLDYVDGMFRLTTYRAHTEGDRVIVRPDPPLGRYHTHHGPHPARDVEVVVLMADGTVRRGRGRDGKGVET